MTNVRKIAEISASEISASKKLDTAPYDWTVNIPDWNITGPVSGKTIILAQFTKWTVSAQVSQDSSNVTFTSSFNLKSFGYTGPYQVEFLLIIGNSQNIPLSYAALNCDCGEDNPLSQALNMNTNTFVHYPSGVSDPILSFASAWKSC